MWRMPDLIDVGRNFGRAFLTTEPVPEPDPVRDVDADRVARELGEHVNSTKLAALPFPDALEKPPVLGPVSARHEKTRAAVERLLAITR